MLLEEVSDSINEMKSGENDEVEANDDEELDKSNFKHEIDEDLDQGERETGSSEWEVDID